MDVRCPNCGSIVTAPPGKDPVCARCGFTAPLPPSLVPPAWTPPPPPGHAPWPPTHAQAPPTPPPASAGAAPPPYYGAPPATYGPPPVPMPAPPGAYPAPSAYLPYAAAPPVAGKPRSYWKSLGLGIITFTVYFYVWQYKVYREVDKEHGYEHEEIWFWLGIFVFGLFYIFYHVKEMRKLNGARQMRGMAEGVRPGQFFLWYILGALILVGPFIAFYKLSKSINQLWAVVYQTKGVPWPSDVPTPPA